MRCHNYDRKWARREVIISNFHNSFLLFFLQLTTTFSPPAKGWKGRINENIFLKRSNLIKVKLTNEIQLKISFPSLPLREHAEHAIYLFHRLTNSNERWRRETGNRAKFLFAGCIARKEKPRCSLSLTHSCKRVKDWKIELNIDFLMWLGRRLEREKMFHSKICDSTISGSFSLFYLFWRQNRCCVVGRLCIYTTKFFIIILQICTNFIISWESSTVSHRNTTLECVLRDGWKLCRCINDEILFFRFRVQLETSRNHLSIEASPTDNADET